MNTKLRFHGREIKLKLAWNSTGRGSTVGSTSSVLCFWGREASSVVIAGRSSKKNMKEINYTFPLPNSLGQKLSQDR